MKLEGVLDINQEVIILYTNYEKDYTEVIYPDMTLEQAIQILQQNNVKVIMTRTPNKQGKQVLLTVFGDNVIELHDSCKAYIVVVVRK